jgi:hypothetical protein
VGARLGRARLKFPAPATAGTWVTGSRGDPLLVVIGKPPDSLAGQIRGLLPDLRGIVGDGARPALCSDRGSRCGSRRMNTPIRTT